MEDDYFPIILGFGSTHDLRDEQGVDPRNPRLAGLRSVSYAGAVGLARSKPKPAKPRQIGFKIAKVKR